jgi:hypothetical protein
MSANEAKINEKIAVNQPRLNEKNITKFNKDYNNFNERVNNTLNQQQNAINKTLDNTLHNVKKRIDEATREIPQYTQRIAEYQKKTLQTVKDIASDVIEAQKQVVSSFQTQIDNNSSNFNTFWNLYNPQRIAENNAVLVNNFTSYLLNANNLINTTLASNLRIYNTALEQTRDNLNTLTKTNTDYIKSVPSDTNDKEVNITTVYNN